ncbi:MAG: L-threonylcarbamoyladenylate synthase [Pigmentiphaga sp.]|uniref:L-threonylcarbamoyladenylate synthase n=1 Tax=Pigmentiphaga sp. TaxID=1977564 RepID=UPI0029AEF31D|nr:L-threonylcarbamoyladenylate synthase [Pigmentiphaga sp.]MDX3904731.1 L-threonylcarbamoyladenylate synthase [Pigmentiphaga sp.]
MAARILPPSTEAIAEAAALLRAGQLVGMPTETVYGLAADASSADAVARIFAAKGRPNDHPVIVHVAAGADLSRWAARIPEAARRLMAGFWPGPLTLILPRAPGVLDAVTGRQDTVGLRCPSHPVAQALLSAFGGGLAAPSANRFGRVSPTTAQHVAEEFDQTVPLVLDGGPCAVGIESTIVDVSTELPILLRPGHVSAAALSAVLGSPVLTPAQMETRREVPRVSGALSAHYAPRTALRLADPDVLAAEVAAARGQGATVGVWSAREPAGATVWLPAPSEPEAYAQALYATLRELDGQGLDMLLLESPPATPAWAAIRDRLGRACVGSGTR